MQLKLLKNISRKNFLSFERLAFIGIAAVILFGLLFYDKLDNTLAFFENNPKEPSLIIEESLTAKPYQSQEDLLRKGSYVYNLSYSFIDESDDSEAGLGGSDFSGNILVQGIAFLGSSNPLSDPGDSLGIFDRQRSGIIVYEVQTSDTPSYIAAFYGISTETLLWANNLNYYSVIKPGDKLTILPISGVFHEIKKRETLESIVKQYKGDLAETLAYNGLPADGFVYEKQKIIIPNGKKNINYSPRARFASLSGPYSGKSHSFPWGQCTWYVAQKKYVPWAGDAKNWISNAERSGYSICRGHDCLPQPGSIVSLAGDTWTIRRYGHVAYVESINESWITLSEMNYLGLGIKTVRTIPRHDGRIMGYIY